MVTWNMPSPLFQKYELAALDAEQLQLIGLRYVKIKWNVNDKIGTTSFKFYDEAFSNSCPKSQNMPNFNCIQVYDWYLK